MVITNISSDTEELPPLEVVFSYFKFTCQVQIQFGHKLSLHYSQLNQYTSHDMLICDERRAVFE
jgi:hypothetical protein